MVEKKKSIHVSSAERSNYRKSIILAWVMKHRPDIYEAANKEAYKKFPYTRRPKRDVVIPDSLSAIQE